MIQSKQYKKYKIAGRFRSIFEDTFHKYIHEYDDVTQHKCKLTAFSNCPWVKFEVTLVGRNYERINKFISQINSFTEVTDTEYGQLKNGNIV